MEPYVDVYVATDITFAYLVKAQLENAGIPVQVENEQVSGAYCLDGMAPRVRVPAAQEREALDILAQMQKATDQGFEDESQKQNP
ncbi:DUF2007 domain-containing protein [Planctomycetota bacterium]